MHIAHDLLQLTQYMTGGEMLENQFMDPYGICGNQKHFLKLLRFPFAVKD